MNSHCFFFNDTATTEIYTLSLHDALPISVYREALKEQTRERVPLDWANTQNRSEEHTSELQSPDHLVCRLLLEKKNTALALCSDGGAAGVTRGDIQPTWSPDGKRIAFDRL